MRTLPLVFDPKKVTSYELSDGTITANYEISVVFCGEFVKITLIAVFDKKKKRYVEYKIGSIDQRVLRELLANSEDWDMEIKMKAFVDFLNSNIKEAAK